MAISDDLNSIRTHLEDDYEALEQLGVSVEDRNIENIKDMANQIYAKFPKTEFEEGSDITLENTLKGKLDFENGIVGIGDTSQKSYGGKNLYPSGTSTQTIAGVTFTPQEDGSLKLNGTSTYSNYYVAGGESNYVQVENLSNIAETVTLSVSGIHQEGIQVYVVGSTLGPKGLAVNGSTTFTTNLNDTYRIFVRVATGTVANSTIKIQLEKGSSATNFEKYVGGTASPNPSYPQDIEVVRGKNLLPNNATTQTVNGVTFTKYDDGSVLVNGTATANIQYDLLLASENKKISAGNYYLSGCPSGGTAETYRLVIGVNGTLYGEYGSGRAVTLSSGVLNSYIYIQNGATVTNKLYKPMLEKGSQVTSYLPYNTLEVVERGKNYCGFNSVSSTGMGVDYIIDKSEITLNGTTNGGGYIYTSTTNFITIPKGTYKLSGYILGGSYNYVGDIEIALKKVSDNTKVLTLYKTHYDNQATITLTEDTDLYYGIYTNGSNNVLNNFKIGIQIETGSTATTYEPYQTPQSYQLSLGEYEFAKIGNYVDTIEYDVENDKVYKNKAILKFDLVSTLSWRINSGQTWYYTDSFKTTLLNTAGSDILSNCFLKGNWNNTESANKICLGNTDYGMVGISKPSFNSLDDLKTFLDNNNVYVYAPLKVAVKEEITTTLADQIKALYYSHSFTGTTIIEIDGQLPLIIKVSALKGE